MTVKSLSILSRYSCRTSWVYYIGLPDEKFWQMLKHPKICLNALDLSRLTYLLPLGALLGCLAGYVPLFFFINLFLIALCANGLGVIFYEAKGKALAHKIISFSEEWQQQIGAPCDDLGTTKIETAIALQNGQDFLVFTHLREVYYLPRHCLLGESNVRLLEACTRHFT